MSHPPHLPTRRAATRERFAVARRVAEVDGRVRRAVLGAVDAVGDDGQAGRLARARASQGAHWAALDLVDVETVAVLRKRWRAGDLTARRFNAAVDDLLALPMDRFPTGPLMVRTDELRANVAPYAAANVALAEALGYTLVTADARLSWAPGIRCRVDVLST